MTSKKISTTGIGNVAPVTVYSNSKENNDLSPNSKVVLPGNVVGPMSVASAELDSNEIDIEVTAVDDPAVVVANPNPLYGVPQLSDIQLISNSVVYDAAGNPSVTAVFKIKNSSGRELKGINVRVQSA
jgi:hypothetical protein